MTDVPGRKRARKVPRRIILVSRIWDTAWGQRVGVWDRSCGAFSAAPAAPLCAPQTDQQPAATFTAPITVRPPVRVKSRKFRNPLLKAQWILWRMCRNKVRAGEVASECQGERASVVPKLQPHSALLGQISERHQAAAVPAGQSSQRGSTSERVPVHCARS